MGDEGGTIWSKGARKTGEDLVLCSFFFSHPDPLTLPKPLFLCLSAQPPLWYPAASSLPEAASRMREFTVRSAGRPVGRGRHGAGPGDGSSCARLPPLPAQHRALPAPTGGLQGKQQGTFSISEPQTCLLQGAWRETRRKIISSQRDSRKGERLNRGARSV